MSPRKILGVLVSVLALGSLPLAVACSTGGERTRTGCPAGEQCSTMVEGLHFAGVQPEAHTVFAIAQGGTQRLRVQTTAGLTGAAYTGEFDARSSDPNVLDIGSAAGAEVTVLGEGNGHAFLRIVEPGTEILLDRIDIRVAPVSSVRVTSVAAAFSGEVASDIRAVWSGASVQLVLGLVDSDGEVLWDDSFEVIGHPSTFIELPQGFQVNADAPDSGALVLTVMHTGGPHLVSVPVVLAATGIALLGGSDPIELEVGQTASICAMGRVVGGLIAGAPVEVTLPSIVSDAPDAVPVLDGMPIDGCVGVRGTTVGTGTAIVAIEPVTTELQITVVPATTSPLTGPAIDVGDARGWSSAGARASD